MKFLTTIIYCYIYSRTVVDALWPIPRSLQTGSTVLKLSPHFDITISQQQEHSAWDEDLTDIYDAIFRIKGHLLTDKLGRLVPGRGEEDQGALLIAPILSHLTLRLEEGASLRAISTEMKDDLTKRNEGYSLVVPSDGSPATLTAASSLGWLRGLTTFEQLWYWVPGHGSVSAEGTVYSHQAPVVVCDSPAYPYRGFMLDTARNFFPVVDIKRTLDAMSMVKLNVFHWHVVDSQSFPLDIPGFSELSEKGAYSKHEIYSTRDVQDIVKYAAERGIEVLMEIDTPGHTAIIANVYPEHIACPGASPWSQYANEPPAGQLRLASAATTEFTVSMLTSIAKTLPSNMFSTGGDEINVNCYQKDASTQKDLKDSNLTLEGALDAFTQRTHGALRQTGKKAVVWEEMALEHRVTLANDTIVMVWISSKNAAKVAKKGLHIVHAPSDYFYLDCGGGEWIGGSAGTNSWCDPFKSWQKAYTFDPLASILPSQAPLVLGGQQLLWAEQASPANLDPIVWPRAAVSAEIFWTGSRLPDGKFRSVKEALPRLNDVRFRMVQRGIRAIALQPHWCVLRPGECDSGGLSSMVRDFAFRKWVAPIVEWYRRIAYLLSTRYRELRGFNEL